jgi:hypothetical protein
LCDETCTLKEIQIQERNRLEIELNSRVHELYVEMVNLLNKQNKQSWKWKTGSQKNVVWLYRGKQRIEFAHWIFDR